MQWSRRRALWQAASSGMLLWGGWSRAQDSVGSSSSPLPRHMTAEAEHAIRRGLNWLKERQRSDGGFGAARTYARNVGVCALGGMAFLSNRHPAEFAANIRGCTNYLLSRIQPNGFIVEEDVVTHAPMYGHGFATMYLGQIYGSDRRSEVRRALKNAVSLIVSLQDESGAWRYTPFPEDADVSVTTCQMLALCSARQAGIAVPRSAIQRSAEFLRRCQNPDGGFRYRLIDPPESLFPRSAAAVAALHASGLHDDPAVLKGREYLTHPSESPTPQQAEYYFYGRYYATHAAWQAGEESWDRWYPVVLTELLQRQSADGNWHDPNIGDEYATAMALIVMQFPFDCVPLFAL